MIYYLLFAPLIAAIVCLFFKNNTILGIISVIATGFEFGLIIYVSNIVFTAGSINQDTWFVDGLSAYVLLIIGFITLLVSIYSIGYLNNRLQNDVITPKKVRIYYVTFHIFNAAMVLALISNNLGVMWVALETTTLVSAVLVAIYDTRASIEAAWKYIIICSVGMMLALLGTIFIYATSIGALGESEHAFNWTFIVENAANLDPKTLKLAFVFIFIGFGTKIGFVPMHTWLPDTYSQAPAPFNVLSSGALLNVAYYGLIRYHIIEIKAIGPEFTNTFFLVFGLISLIIAAGFIISAKKSYMRLLSYSTIEHVAIIAIAIGIGGPIGLFGAFLHMFNHAMTKSLLFFGSGNLQLKYRTQDMEHIKGSLKIMPLTSAIFLLGVLALTGNPPFGMIMSEFIIMNAMVQSNQAIIALIFILILVGVFAAFLSRVSKMVFGKAEEREDVDYPIEKGEISKLNVIVMVVLLVVILCIGLYIPDWFNTILQTIVSIF